MKSQPSRLANKFFKDKKGNLMIFQKPNFPLAAWLVIMLISFLAPAGDFRSGLRTTASAFLFCWAYLEFTRGASYYRMALGAAILISIIVGYFNA